MADHVEIMEPKRFGFTTSYPVHKNISHPRRQNVGWVRGSKPQLRSFFSLLTKEWPRIKTLGTPPMSRKVRNPKRGK